MKLDIACGKNKKSGFIGVDIWEGAEIVCDLEKFPWPFEDGTVDAIYCSHYIEHTKDLISFANELYRIMKVGAKAEIIAPYYSSIRAWQDPTHLRAISEATFLYFNKDWRKTNRLDHYPITADFDFTCSYLIDPNWRNKDSSELDFAMKHYINVVSDIYVILVKRPEEDEMISGLMARASDCWDKHHYRKAVALCRECLQKKSNLQAHLMIGEYSLKHKKFDEAIQNFLAAVSLDTESLEAN